MTLGSLFDGAGTCPYAATLYGVTPVWASEIEPFPIEVTTKRFPNMKHLGDITLINGAEIEPVDIITFGSPCQDLSVAGAGRGMVQDCPDCGISDLPMELEVCPICGVELESTRSGLFMEAVRIFKEMREATNGVYPRFVMWENVPGAFSSNKGEDFRTVLEEICKIKDSDAVIPRPKKWSDAGEILADGYSLAWRVLDAQFWGVPQRRRRIFLVADFGGQRAGEILFKRESLRWNPAESREAGQGTTADTESGFRAAGFNGNAGAKSGSVAFHVEKTPTLKAGQDTHCLQSAIAFACNQRDEVRDLGNTAAALQAQPGMKQQTFIAQSAGFNGHKSITGSIQYAEETAPTLESNMPSNVICYNPWDSQSERVYSQDGIWHSLNANSSGGQSRDAVIAYACRTDQTGSNGLGISEDVAYTLDQARGQAVAFDCRNLVANEVSGTLQAKEGGGHSLNYVNPVVCSIQRSDEYKESEQASTLSARDYKSATDLVVDGYIARRLMPVECARLQGMPDWWTADVPHKDAPEYKMWGNGMALPCVMYVMEGLTGETAMRILDEKLGIT